MWQLYPSKDMGKDHFNDFEMDWPIFTAMKAL